jgi:nucleoside-diphosphate-sugar epimerase
MRVFVTGANGWIGSGAVRELVGAGHDVVGMARSDEGLAKVKALGATPLQGTLADHDVLRSAAADSDGVVHMAYVHDFSSFEAINESAVVDRAAIEALASGIEGTDRPLLVASGVLGLGSPDALATESLRPAEGAHPRTATAALVLALADRGIKPGVVRFPPTVHGEGDVGFIKSIADVARERGVSAYVGDGAICWSGVHRDDAAVLLRLAVEQAPTDGVLHCVADEAVPLRDIAEAIGRQLNVPAASISADESAEHFGWIAMVLGMDGRASSAQTRDLLGWQPTHPSLIEDLDAGYYTRS